MAFTDDEKKELETINTKIAAIEKEFGGFSNIPPAGKDSEHEYWGLLRRQRFLTNLLKQQGK